VYGKACAGWLNIDAVLYRKLQIKGDNLARIVGWIVSK
jgi:hypothetical protein